MTRWKIDTDQRHRFGSIATAQDLVQTLLRKKINRKAKLNPYAESKEGQAYLKFAPTLTLKQKREVKAAAPAPKKRKTRSAAGAAAAMQGEVVYEFGGEDDGFSDDDDTYAPYGDASDLTQEDRDDLASMHEELSGSAADGAGGGGSSK